MPTPVPQRDPILWCAGIALAFLALCWHRLGIPSEIYFDEVHYVKAARSLLDLTRANPEHPMLGKEIIASAIWLLGDRPIVWRAPFAVLGAAGLFAFGRLVWLASRRRVATVTAMILLATNFMWFIQSRIAMLDMAMAGFAMLALWQFAAATALPGRRARLHLVLCGLCLGLSISAKWSVAPAAVLPGLAFLVLRLRDHGRHFLTRTGTRPVPGVSLIEAAIWLGVLPLAIYWASFMPAFFLIDHPIDPLKMIEHHRYMLRLQDSVVKPHPYRSVWYQWIADWRAVWYLYKEVDGVQRGIVLIGNPVSMILGLAALGWAVWAAIWRRRSDAAVFALLYAACLGLWIVTEKPIQFYYHYLLPSTFLMACLALALDWLWSLGGKWRWLPMGMLAVTCAVFIHFYPIISAAALHKGKASYADWMWLKSWR